VVSEFPAGRIVIPKSTSEINRSEQDCENNLTGRKHAHPE
jgi:hypothetical protein